MSFFGLDPFAFFQAQPQSEIEDPVIHLESNIEESIPESVEQFVRLSKHGQFRRARLLFEDVLKPHLFLFPVAAEYAHFLLEQGNFRDLEHFLTDHLRSVPSFDDDELQLLRLLLAFARIHTRGLLREAVEEARDTTRCLSHLTIDTIDDVQVRKSL